MSITLPHDIDHERPWLWPFDLPFPEPPSVIDDPRYAALCAETMQWLHDQGIVENESDVEQQRRHNLPSWPVLCYPTAPLEGLRLISDWTSWWGFWDSMLVIPEHRNHGSDIFASMLRILNGGSNVLVDTRYQPFVEAYRDIWHRWRQGMPEHWVRRTADNWRRSLMGFIDEYSCIREGYELSESEILASRDLTGLNYLILDMIERASGYVLAVEVFECQTMQEIRFHANREIWLTQELQSHKKEEEDGEPNLVLTLEHNRGISRIEACQLVHRMIRQHTDSFLECEAGMPSIMDRLGIEPRRRISVYRYIDGMRTVMAGTAAFVVRSGRYS